MTTPTPQIQSEAERLAHLIYARLIPKDDPVPCPISDLIATALMEARQAALGEVVETIEKTWPEADDLVDAIRDLAAKPPAQGEKDDISLQK